MKLFSLIMLLLAALVASRAVADTNDENGVAQTTEENLLSTADATEEATAEDLGDNFDDESVPIINDDGALVARQGRRRRKCNPRTDCPYDYYCCHRGYRCCPNKNRHKHPN